MKTSKRLSLLLAAGVLLGGCELEEITGSDDTSDSSQSIEFSANDIILSDAQELTSFSANLSDYLTGDDSNWTISSSNTPSWLTLEADGSLLGSPSEDDLGDYSWQVSLDGSNSSDTATIYLTVRSSEWFQVLALSELTDSPAVYDANGDEYSIDTTSGEIQEIYYQALDYEGEETRAYAYIGIPSDVETPMPAMVLVHGGGGTAYSAWVEKWMERGYAAISIAVEGQTAESDPDGGWMEHDWAGPSRSGIYGDANPENEGSYVDLIDQWMYHAVADTILANSLLRSLDVVDAEHVGLMGVSWGGVITSTVMGIDQRFALAIPVYGCGHMYDSRNWWSKSLSYNSLYHAVWDPMVRMDRAEMPSLWISWSGDNNFGMDSFAYSYEAAAGDHMVSLIPNMGHGHNAAWSASDSYEFADSIFNGGAAWFENLSQTEQSSPGDEVSMTFTSNKELATYSLRYTSGSGFTGDLDWFDETANITHNSDGSYTISAVLPEETTGWYFSLSDDDVYFSSDYIEIVELYTSPADELIVEVASGDSSASSSVELSFTGPTNIDIQGIEFSNSDHLDAFSSDLTPEVELDSDTLTETLTVSFDNSVAGLQAGESSSATLTFSWETLAGDSKTLALPITVNIAE